MVQKCPVFQFFFLANIEKENVFDDILERKNAFLGYKNKKLKKPRNWHFSMVLVQKCPFFQLFLFSWYRPWNVFSNILEQKNAFLGYKNNNFKKSKNWDFSKGFNLGFWSKNGHSLNFIFLANIGWENVFYIILERKNAFLDYKKKKFNKSKNSHFSNLFFKAI